MVKLIIKKSIPSKKVFKTVGRGKTQWYNGKVYFPLSFINKKSRENIKGAIQLGNSNSFLYTLDKKRRIKGFAPKNLL